MKELLATLVFILTSLLDGCRNELIVRTISPPSDTKWVNVEVKNPSPWTRPSPLDVRYISTSCKYRYIDMSDGSHREEPGASEISIPLQQQGKSDIWRGRVAMDGGSFCDWKLSQFRMSIEYIDATHLGSDLLPGSGGVVIVAFDDLASQNGPFKSILGNVNLTPKYYPLITEWHIVQRKKTLSLLGGADVIYVRAYNPQKISFSPMLDEKKLTRFVEPEKKTEGVHSKIIYPDGSMAPYETLLPDFNKVDKMKIPEYGQ
ncbi:hypothetical protein [Enterobacter kobei]|uniref:hypothetical protein n=1 Tax=Enterobacter kobei TaxID=208224 RepID=UPI003CEF6EBE